MAQRRRYATRDELAERLVEVMQGRLTTQGVRDVLDALAELEVAPDSMLKITVDEPVP